MNCEQYQLEISKMFDGLLDASVQRNLFVHLGTCDDCRKFFGSVNTIRLSFRKVDRIETREVIDLNVLRNNATAEPLGVIRDHQPVRRQVWNRTVPIPISTIVILILMLFVGGIMFTNDADSHLANHEPPPPELVLWQQSLSRN